MRCSGQVATLIVLLTVLSLSIRPAAAFNLFKYFFGDTTSRSAKTSPKIVSAKAIDGVTPHPDYWDSDEASPILITASKANDKTQYRIQGQSRKNFNGSFFGRPDLVRRERLKFRNSDARSKRLKRIFRERATSSAKFKAALERNIQDETVRYETNTANILLVMGKGGGSEEKSPFRRTNVFGLDEPLIIIDVEELAKKVNNQNIAQPIYDSDIQVTADDIIEDQSYFLSEKVDEPNYQRERFRHEPKQRTRQLGKYYRKLLRNRPNKGSNRDVRGNHFSGDYGNYYIRDDRIDSFQRSAEPNQDFSMDEKSGIYEDSPIQVSRDTRFNKPTFDGQGSWIVVLDSGKYRINKDSITKLDNMHIDKRKIFHGDSTEPEEFHYKEVDYIDDYKYQNKRSTSSSKEIEHNDFSFEDDVQDVIIEYDTKGFKDINGVKLVIARGQEEDMKRFTSYKQESDSEKTDSNRNTTPNSKELNKNKEANKKKGDSRLRNTPKDLVEHAARHRPQGGGSDRRSRNSSKSRSNQDSQAQSTSRRVIPLHLNNRPIEEKFHNTRYPTQNIERMSPIAVTATDDFEIPNIVAGAQNFHSLEEWTGSVSPTDKSLFESSKKEETTPTIVYHPQRSYFSHERNLSRWATMNRSRRHSANISPGWRPAAPYPSAFDPRPPDYRRF